MNSILPPSLRGVMFITGYRGIGKSFLASQADLPSRIAFFDFESKGAGIDSQLHFGLYRAFNQEAKSALGMWDLMYKTFSELEQGKYTVAVLDNIAHMELALSAEVIRNANKYADEYGLDAQKIKRNAWGQQHAAVNALLGAVCSLLHSRGVKLVVATSHIKSAWAGGQAVPNKWRIKGHDRWQELSILTLILIPGDNPPVPAALVQKEQLGTITLDESVLTPEQLESMLRGESGHTVARRLPRRIPDCTFQRIRWYLTNPADMDNPADGETPTEAEADPFIERMSREQLAFVTLALQNTEREESYALPAAGSINPLSLITQAQAPKPTPEAQSKLDEAIARGSELATEMEPDEVRQALLDEGYSAPIVAQAMRKVQPF